MIKVALRDDDREFCRMLLDELAQDHEVRVFAAESDQDLPGLIAGIQPDVAVLDCMNPVERGMAMIQAIMNMQPEIQVLVVSNIGDDRFVQKLLELGAAYYLIKPFPAKALIDRIKYVHRHCGNRFNHIYWGGCAHIQQFAAGCLARLGIPPNYKGHRYLLDAIILAGQNHSWLDGITTKIYPAVAKRNRTTAAQVERSIRYAIDTAWTKGDLDQLHKLFPYTIDPAKGKPTNSAFIAKMADIIRLRFPLP